MEAYGHSLSVTKHAFFVLCMYGASKHYPNIQGVSIHKGGIQTYGWCANKEASKHTGGVQTYGGIQTYRMHPHIWGHPNVWGNMDTRLV